MEATQNRTGARTCCEHYGIACQQGRDCPAYRDEMRAACGIVLAVAMGLMVWASIAAAFIAYSSGGASKSTAIPTATSCTLRSAT